MRDEEGFGAWRYMFCIKQAAGVWVALLGTTKPEG